MSTPTTIKLSREAEAMLVEEQAIALGTRMLSIPEFALRVEGSETKHALQKVRDRINAGLIPAKPTGSTYVIHWPTYVAAGAKGVR